MRKPPACSGCPAEHRGHLFVPDDHKPDARVRVVMQNPGEAEEMGRRFVRWYKGEEGTGEIWADDVPRPAIGKSGWELDNKFLPLAGLKRDDVEVCNVVRCRLNKSNDLPPLTTTMAREMVTHCQRSYWKEPHDSQTMVALGAYALWALTGEYEGDDDDADAADDDLRASKSVDGWRGWLLPYRPSWGPAHAGKNNVYVSYHPSFYYRAHWLKPVGKADFSKLGRYLRGVWPEAFPEMRQGMAPIVPQWPLAFDTEYNPWTKELHRYSLAWRSQDRPVVWVTEAGDQVGDHGYDRATTGGPQLIMQNAEADWPFIKSIFGAEPTWWQDTMYAHAVLYGTLRHSLDFMGSLYARHNRWKHLQQSDPLTYSGMDALATYDIWQQLRRELQRDRLSADLYEQELKPLLSHVMARPSIRLDAMHIAQAAQELKREQEELVKRGQVVAGWPLNIGSADQVSRWLRLKHD